MDDLPLRALSAASFVLLAPVLIPQGRYVRRVTPKLPPAADPRDGVVEGSTPLRLLIAGESTAVGVGVATHEDGLAGRTARALAASTGRGVSWRVLGRSGASAHHLVAEFIVPAAPLVADVVIVALGVNDTISLSSVARWIDALEDLRQRVRAASPDAAIVLSGVPPMQLFPAFPAPLRHVLGLRARVLDRAAVRWAARQTRITHVPHPAAAPADVPELFCADRFHPSALGYERWSISLSAAAAALLR